MRAIAAVFVLAATAQAIAAAQQPASHLARAAAEREATLAKQIAAAPTDPMAYYELANLQERFGAFAEAEATLVKAQRALATNKDVALDLADFYSRRKQFEKRMAMLQAAARLDPADAGLQMSITRDYYDKVHDDKTLGPAQRLTFIREAIAAADRGLAIAPSEYVAFVKDALIAMRATLTPDPANAAMDEAVLAKVIAAVPADPAAYFDLAILQEGRGAFAEAEATLVKAQRALATNKDAALELAAFYSRREQFDKSMAMLHTAAGVAPADADLQDRIAAYCYAKADEDKTLGPPQRLIYIREGIAAADRAIAAAPEHVAAIVDKISLLRLRARLIADPAQKNRVLAEAAALQAREVELVWKRPAFFRPAPPSPLPPAPPPESPPPVKVGSGIKPPVKIKDVPPVYPIGAVAARVEGMVVVEATINAAGGVSDAKVLRSVPLLDQAALDAVRQWVFSPTLVDGQPVAVVMAVTVTFSLK